jgi:protein phosphatase
VLPEAGAFVVADGMGGEVAGELAAGMAVATLRERLAKIGGDAEPATTAVLSRAIIAANEEIFQRTVAEEDKRGMGTTVTAMALRGARYVIGHVGDSRAYVIRDGEVHQITKDHSWVQEQVDAGYLTAEQARTHPYVSVITRCVGASPEVEADVYSGSVRSGDVFMLATDGLTNMLGDEEILWMTSLERSPKRLVNALIDEANRMGGLDNVTVIVVRIDGEDRDS